MNSEVAILTFDGHGVLNSTYFNGNDNKSLSSVFKAIKTENELLELFHVKKSGQNVITAVRNIKVNHSELTVSFMKLPFQFDHKSCYLIREEKNKENINFHHNFKSIPFAILVFNRNKELHYFNQHAENILGTEIASVKYNLITEFHEKLGLSRIPGFGDSGEFDTLYENRGQKLFRGIYERRGEQYFEILSFIYEVPSSRDFYLIEAVFDISKRFNQIMQVGISEVNNRNIVSGIPLPFVIVFQNQILFSNDVFQRITNINNKDVKNIKHIIHPDDRYRFSEWLNKQSREETGYFQRLRVKTPDNYRWMGLSSQKIHFNNHVCDLIFFNDVTEEQNEISKLVEENDKYRQMVENAHDAFFIVFNNKIQYANPRALRLLDYSEEQLYSMDVVELIHPHDLKVFRKIDKILRNGKNIPDEMEIRIINGKGSVIYLETNVSYISFQDNNYLLATARDITKRKAIEQKIMDLNQELLESVKDRTLSHVAIDSANELIFLADENASFIRVNDMLCKVSGYSREQIVNKNIFLIFPDMIDKPWDQFWKEFIRNKYFRCETYLLNKRKKTIPVEIRFTYVEYDNKEYFIAFANDITEKVKAFTKIEEQLEEINNLKKKLEFENIYLQEEIKLSHDFTTIISDSPKIKKILREIEQVAETNSTVLLLGETGTGKELLARAIHAISPRKDHPLVKVNCAALPVELIESELFGNERGAFTGAYQRKIGRFEVADGGTIFLDEIGELPLELQPKLLRVLQDGEFERLGSHKSIKVDVRVIAATNRDLEEEVKKGNFRKDLYYRLNVFPIKIPPLRERKEDIPLLVKHFIKKYAEKHKKKINPDQPLDLKMFYQYSWPGNIRELENIIERAVIISRNGIIRPEINLKKNVLWEENTMKSLAELEREYIHKVLEQTGWRVRGKNGAAEILGLKPTTLEARMKKLGIKRP